MAVEWREAVFRIDSAAEGSHGFGTGFVCHREGDKTYLLTCNHVIAAIGEDQARIRQLPIQVVARGDDAVDLALIAVDGLAESPILPLGDSGTQGQPFQIYGHTRADPRQRSITLARLLNGKLGSDPAFYSRNGEKVPAWDLSFDKADDFAELLEGYSGSPVWDPQNRQVIAVVSHRRGTKMGYAIAVSNLLKFYPQAAAFRAQSNSQSKSHYGQENTLNPDQIPLEPPSTIEFKATITKALNDLFSHSRLAGAARILVGTQAEVVPTKAVDLLLQMEPLEAVNEWNGVVNELYDTTSIMGEAQRDVWTLLESVHLYLLPRLVDLTRLVNDTRFPQDALLFSIAAPHEPPNRPIELLFARMNRKRVVQFEQRGRELARDFAVPCTELDVTDPDFCARADPDIESAVEQLGFELMKRFSMNPPEQMRPYDWEKLDARLKAGRHGKRGFYLVIPHANHYADAAVLSRLYRYLPNLPKFLMADAVGDDLPFVCKPVDIDAAIEEFWDLKNRWCGDQDSQKGRPLT